MHQEAILTTFDWTVFWQTPHKLESVLPALAGVDVQHKCRIGRVPQQAKERTHTDQLSNSYIESAPVVELHVTPVQRDTSTKVSQSS